MDQSQKTEVLRPDYRDDPVKDLPTLEQTPSPSFSSLGPEETLVLWMHEGTGSHGVIPPVLLQTIASQHSSSMKQTGSVRRPLHVSNFQGQTLTSVVDFLLGAGVREALS